MNSQRLNERRAARYYETFVRRPYISTEFDILDAPDPTVEYWMVPKGDRFVAVNDDVYLNNWYDTLAERRMPSYFNDLGHPGISLNRWGVTLIPPESVPTLLEVVVHGPHFGRDPQLTRLAALLRRAIAENKFIIHYGV